MSADGSHITAPDEEGSGAARAMSHCLDDAELNPDDVDYINAHGTSTGLGDMAETKADEAGLRRRTPRKLTISSTKSQLGHLLGASGGVELVASALAINTASSPRRSTSTTPTRGATSTTSPTTPARPGSTAP